MKKNLLLVFFVMLLSYSNSTFAAGCYDNDSTLKPNASLTTAQTAAAIQAAIKYCNGSGGGTVRLTAGTYTTAPIVVASNVNLHIDSGATLLASPVTGDWGASSGLITGSGSSSKPFTNISITGNGTIDGNGAIWWPSSGTRPRIINVQYINNLTIDSIHVRNSPKENIFFSYCNNVIIDNVNVYDTSTSPNTDGIDPADCKNVFITNCTIDDGDDCIAIKAGRNGSTLVPGGCQDITVANCTFKHGHGLSIGSESNSGYKNLRVVGCTFNGTDYGIRVKSALTAGGLMENLYYSDITMTNINKSAIYIDMNYNTTGCCSGDMPSVKGLYVNNVTATVNSSSSSSDYPAYIAGVVGGLVSNVVFNKVNITSLKGYKLPISNTAGITFNNVTINNAPAKSGTNITVGTNVTGISGF